MSAASRTVPVAIELGSKRVFATALDWPGWCRAGKDEELALAALEAARGRYIRVLGDSGGLGGGPSRGALAVVERLEGGASTDFGAPGTPPSGDSDAPTSRELARLVTILRCCWGAFDAAAAAAEGVELSTGPRGGGRTLAKIRDHAWESERAYLRALGGTAPKDAGVDEVRDAFVEALGARARGELPDVGPRGGKRWSARFAARYAAWHALDHASEIEDRAG